MKSKHIIAGRASMIEYQGIMQLGPVILYGLGITGRSAPKLCYLRTAVETRQSGRRVFILPVWVIIYSRVM